MLQISYILNMLYLKYVLFQVSKVLLVQLLIPLRYSYQFFYFFLFYISFYISRYHYFSQAFTNFFFLEYVIFQLFDGTSYTNL